MKTRSLRRVLFFYSLMLLGSIPVLCVLFYGAFLAGAQYHLYSFANSEERQAEALQERIEEEKNFDPSWVPDGMTYIVVDQNHRIISSNASVSDQDGALAFLKGDASTHSGRYFMKASYPEGTCVVAYRIGVRYSSEWANQHLPRMERFFFVVLLFIVLLPTALFVRAITRRLQRDVVPLKHVVTSIGKGDLNLPVPALSIEEFQELGVLTERMRLDLKSTLEALWVKEHQITEATTQMLHDCRCPLTVARVNAEFLREDLARLKGREDVKELLKYVETIIFHLERLTAVTDRLQQHMNSGENGVGVNLSTTFDDLNGDIDKIGSALSEHYGDVWQGHFEECHELLPIDYVAFTQAITNILLNAFEHGRSPQTVRLGFVVHRDGVEYLVTNSGSSFSRRALLHATERGFSEKESDKQISTGLGLFFAKEVLQESGGKLTLSNSSCHHACAKIFLPLAQGEDNS